MNSSNLNSSTTNAFGTNLLSVNLLECARGSRTLFSKLSFSLTSGKLIYLQGANGSGKTTLLRALCGFVQPISGEILWNGTGIHKLEEEFGAQVLYIGHLSGVKEDLTAFENLQFSSVLSGKAATAEQIRYALAQVGIPQCADLPARVLSQGQKRRLALARLWLEQKPLWILDEPFAALDVGSCATLTAHIEAFIHQGGMAIITTHQDPAFKPDLVQHLHLSGAES